MKTRLQFMFGFLLIATIAISQPTITSFTPVSGPVGTSVTITGTNFSATAANNIVFFGATRATVTAATTVQLTVTVPVGATYQPITVVSGGLVGYSAKPFIVTFANGVGIDTDGFAPRVNLTLATSTRSVFIGDFDEDGKTDIAVANSSSGFISVLRNTSTSGTISYAAAINFASAGAPFSVGTGDIDGDGKIDLVAVNSGNSNVSVFRNTSTPGTISFATKVDFTTGSSPYSVTIRDLDGDNKADLAVSNGNGASVSVLRNTGTSGTLSFASKVDFGVGSSPYSVSASDLDGDGKADIVVANADNATVSILKNMGTVGTISFAAKVDIAVGASPRSVSIGDLDGDGQTDLAVANSGANTISLFRNTSTPGTISFSSKEDIAASSAPYSISLGDIDGDGIIDMAVSNASSNTVSVFGNKSTTGAFSFTPKVDFATNPVPQTSVIGDLDGDGKQDILVSNGSTTVSILRNTIRIKQSIIFGALATKTFGDAPFELTATSSSSLPVSYTSSNTAVATVSDNIVTILGGGTTTITALQTGSSTYAPATNVLQTLTVNKANQTITFGVLSEKTVGDPAFSLSAAASSGLPITFTTTSNKVTITNNQVTPISPGRVTITSEQAGNDSYLAAVSVDQSFCIKPAKPIITLSNANTASPILTSNASSGNQWYLNGTAISGATNATLAITQAGVYKVQVQVDDCISTFSDDQPLIVTAVEPGNTQQLTVYPNPAREEVILALNGFENNKPVVIKVVDLLGREFHHTTGTGGEEVRIDVRHYQGGPYILLLTQGHTRIIKQFIKSY